MENIAQRVRSIFSDCFFTEEEVEAARKNGQAVPEGAVLAEGIQGKIGFHPVRLAGHKAEITAILDEMDPSFHKSSGGGMSFLSLCYDKDGVQWTGEHRTCDQLCCLAIAAGLGEYCLPREFWGALPGSMPYLVFDTRQEVTSE